VRLTADLALIDALRPVIGEGRLKSTTRFSSKAPDLGATVETFVASCIGCTDPRDDEAVPHECAQASAALTDLAAELDAVY
jgi:hypothetical protein